MAKCIRVCFSEALPALSYFQTRAVRPTAWKCNMEIGEWLQVPIMLYKKVSPTHFRCSTLPLPVLSPTHFRCSAPPTSGTDCEYLNLSQCVAVCFCFRKSSSLLLVFESSLYERTFHLND